MMEILFLRVTKALWNMAYDRDYCIMHEKDFANLRRIIGKSS